MKTRNLITQIVKWIAIISGTTLLAFVLFFVAAHFVGEGEGTDKALTMSEIISMSLGIGWLLGLAIALFYEGIGGLISTCSIIGFFIVRHDLLANPGIMGLFPIPGILYLIYWYLKTDRNLSSNASIEK
ncbi:MAG TPA: hypothetical protein DCX54_01355 [Flavobacteriales bacterium]|nr:hypothetical protein [Flavobacteriales bacterium]